MSSDFLVGVRPNTPKSCNTTLFVGQKKRLEHKQWVLIDAKGLTVGKVAVVIADHLRAKNKPCFTPQTDCGDNVIVINADLVHFSGNKEITKDYFRHTGYPGGLRRRNPKVVRARARSEILKSAVKGMLSRGPMAYARMKNLYLYSGGEHPHMGQNPRVVDVVAMHRKHRLSS